MTQGSQARRGSVTPRNPTAGERERQSVTEEKSRVQAKRGRRKTGSTLRQRAEELAEQNHTQLVNLVTQAR